jgi:GTP-binding protein
VLVFTKTDKVSKDRLDKNISQYRQRMLRHWETLPPLFLTSSHNKEGREDLLEFIGETLQ